MNIIAVRSSGLAPNVFDDEIHLAFLDEYGTWNDIAFRCTTDPGSYWLRYPMKVEGTAILVPGQYRSAYQIALHQGKYEALCQRGPVRVYRDRNQDEVLDMDPGSIEEGHFGINIHHAGLDSQIVNRWSAGCTVLANRASFEVFMSVLRKSQEIWGDQFTYTLIDQ